MSAPLASSLDDVRAALTVFNRDASVHLDRARNLLSTTTYWVYDPASRRFGPGKFVGLSRE